MTTDLKAILERSSSWHKHLCPRQVLGARMGLAGAAALGLAGAADYDLEMPRRDKRLLVIVETDGCFSSGVEAATGCSVRHRTLRVIDYGKIAATFVDVKTATAVRVAPQLDVRQKAYTYAPDEKKHYFAQLIGYQHMPDAELFTIQPVRLNTDVSQLVSRAGVRVNCAGCGEEIINEREIMRGERPFCTACAGLAYYTAEELMFSSLEKVLVGGANARHGVKRNPGGAPHAHSTSPAAHLRPAGRRTAVIPPAPIRQQRFSHYRTARPGFGYGCLRGRAPRKRC
jgi:formylmethanofuran dehydrogenase subunit E